MDNERFDRLAKSTADGSLRRRLKKGILGGLTGAIIAGSAVGAAGAQDNGPVVPPNEDDGGSWISELLGRFGIGIGPDRGIQVGNDDTQVDIDEDGLEVRTDRVWLRLGGEDGFSLILS